MAQSDHLRLKDICAVFRLIGECRELGREPDAWRCHMLDGLRRLSGARVALHLHLENFGTADERIAHAMDRGFLEASHRALWHHYQREQAHRDDPFHQRYYRDFDGSLRTRTLASVVDMPSWRRSRHYNDYIRPCDLDDRITSSFALAPQPSTAQVVVLHRAKADGPYGRRPVHLMHLFHRELRPLVGRQLALVGPDDDARQLPTKLRAVLTCLLQGDSEKQIASRLHISQHTVSRHVQRLYLRFGVHSRGELLFRCRRMSAEGSLSSDQT